MIMTYTNILPSGGDTGTSLNLRKRIAFFQKFADVQGKKIIDCGCGTGQYLEALLSLGADINGIEYSNEKVTRFRQEHNEIAERIQLGNIEAMDFESDSFDIALLNEVLEHVPNDKLALREIYRVLKPNGILMIFSPNRLYPFESHTVYLKQSTRRLPIAVPFIPYIPLSLGQYFFIYYARNYWPFELRHKVRDCGFKIIATSYFWQTFENISGIQPKFIKYIKPALRKMFALLEQIPVIKIFGVSQVIIAQK